MRWIMIGAVSAFIAVASGAFGAHALKSRLEPDLLAVFETGVRYQMYHSLALVLIGMLSLSRPSAALTGSGWAMVTGMFLFSGSLFALALTGVRALGMITPLGGVAFLLGWGLFAWSARG